MNEYRFGAKLPKYNPDNWYTRREWLDYLCSRAKLRKGRTVKSTERYAYDLLHLAWLDRKVEDFRIHDDGSWEIDGQAYTFAQVQAMVGQTTKRARKPRTITCPHCQHAIAA